MNIDPVVWEVLSRIARYHDHMPYRRIFIVGSFYTINSSVAPIPDQPATRRREA